MFLSVIIATRNRYKVIKHLHENLINQIRKPDEIIIVDASDDPNSGYDWFQDSWTLKFLFSDEASSTKQRNMGIDMLDAKSEIVAFIDDDVILNNDFFYLIEMIYQKDSEKVIAGLGGFVIGEDEDYGPFNKKPVIISGMELYDTKSLYGCNMTFRKDITGKIKFDENLTLYAFLEDQDYSLAANQYGKVVRTKQAKLKHLRVNEGRISEKKFGFALLGNTYYVMKKHHEPDVKIYVNLGKQICIRFIRAIFIKKSRHIFEGSLIALIQIFSGKFSPQNIIKVI